MCDGAKRDGNGICGELCMACGPKRHIEIDADDQPSNSDWRKGRTVTEQEIEKQLQAYLDAGGKIASAIPCTVADENVVPGLIFAAAIIAADLGVDASLLRNTLESGLAIAKAQRAKR